MTTHHFSRRDTLKGLGLAGAAALLAGTAGAAPSTTARLSLGAPPKQASRLRREIFRKVWATPFIDTHEHYFEEHERLSNLFFSNACDDWSCLLSGYLTSDLVVAGMSPADRKDIFARKAPPPAKWKRIEPFWPAVRNTGYGQAARLTLRELYGINELSAATVEQLQARYEQVRRPGFYRRILNDLCRIESVQVNTLKGIYCESPMPALVMQDMSIHHMISPSNDSELARRTGIHCAGIGDWHRIIDWWFTRYGPYSVASKSGRAYQRDINYEQIPAGAVEEFCRRKLRGEPLTPAEETALEDHIFWYTVGKSNEYSLPVKIHTGYYSAEDAMPLHRVRNNPGSACDLCRQSPETRFVFMHLCYPYYEEMLALAKQYTNAWLDMCWGWIINPIAAKDFLKKLLVTVPAHKVLTFGGDYCLVEQTVGHCLMARHGIASALSELVEEGWLGTADAMDLIDPIMHGNARKLFRLEEKEKVLRAAPWLQTGAPGADTTRR
jgi:hypothetical protein